METLIKLDLLTKEEKRMMADELITEFEKFHKQIMGHISFCIDHAPDLIILTKKINQLTEGVSLDMPHFYYSFSKFYTKLHELNLPLYQMYMDIEQSKNKTAFS